jgi:DNA repair photolyase
LFWRGYGATVMVEWLEFGIKPSSFISSLCYSVFRLEPFTTCSYGCVYCYARWYRGPHGRPAVKWETVKLFEKLASKLPENLPKPMFRLATLSDPFQHFNGRVPGAVKALLRSALRLEVPLIVNTKGPLRDPELIPLLQSLADHGLILVQVTVAFSDEVALRLEPGAPLPSERFEIVEALAEHGVPVVVRVQPLIPGLEEEHLWAAEEALERGALGLIGEPLRETREGLETLYNLLNLNWKAYRWEGYQLGIEEGREPLLHPHREWRMWMHSSLEAIASKHGRPYAPCKDMLLTNTRWYRPGRTCCLEWLALHEPPLLRPTLHEYAYLGMPKTPPEELCEILGWPYTCTTSQLQQYPKPIRKTLQAHMKRLWRLINSPKLTQLLEKLQPAESNTTSTRKPDKPKNTIANP